MERRIYPRIKSTFPLELGNPNAKILSSVKGETVDISEGGMRVVTNEPLTSNARIYINLPPCYAEDPKKAGGIEAQVELVWSRPLAMANKFFYGIRFLEIKERDVGPLKSIIKYQIETSTPKTLFTTRPRIDIHREPHSCNRYAIDLSIGCENECKYCHFSKLQQAEWQKKYPLCKDFPIPVDISPIYQMKEFPDSSVYLSPSSDPFASNVKELSHELLSFMFSKGVIFGICTKNIIPDKTIKLLKKYYHLIEGIAISITSLNEERNALLEPNSPPGRERVEHLRKLMEIGCRYVSARMDPMLPLIDDTDDNLNHTINEISKAGVKHLTGAYLFSFGKCLIELNHIPQLKESLKLMTEKSYPLGGVAFSVPLEYKKRTYDKMNKICKSYGIVFNTCGCKELRLRDEGYPLICGNAAYYQTFPA